MQDTNCRATVITPYYDEPLWMIERNIKSVLFQKMSVGKYVQHVISIDFGGEEADKKVQEILAIVKKLCDANPDTSYECCIGHLDKNMGLPAARNAAIRSSKGHYLFLLDTDDMMAYPERVEEQIAFMENMNLDHSYGGYEEIHGEGKPTGKIVLNTDDMMEALRNGTNPCFCGSNCFTIKMVNTIGMFDETMRDGAEDMEYWIRAAIHPDIRSKLMGYRTLYYLGIHGNNMTARYMAEGKFKKAYEYMNQKHDGFFYKV